MIDATKWRVPMGSLIVDASMVVALIWWGATMTAKLDEISRRVSTVEQVRITPEADRRLAVQESKTASIENQLSDIQRLLERIDGKLDRKQDK